MFHIIIKYLYWNNITVAYLNNYEWLLIHTPKKFSIICLDTGGLKLLFDISFSML